MSYTFAIKKEDPLSLVSFYFAHCYCLKYLIYILSSLALFVCSQFVCGNLQSTSFHLYRASSWWTSKVISTSWCARSSSSWLRILRLPVESHRVILSSWPFMCTLQLPEPFPYWTAWTSHLKTSQRSRRTHLFLPIRTGMFLDTKSSANSANSPLISIN